MSTDVPEKVKACAGADARTVPQERSGARFRSAGTAMRSSRVVDTELTVTELGFGASGLGNRHGIISEEESYATVSAAWDAGIRYFDTAPHYGLGLSERRLGEALSGRPREGFVISTKVGRVLHPSVRATQRGNDSFRRPGERKRAWDFSRDGVLRSIEASLARLQLDRIDILYLHEPELAPDPGATAVGAEALIKLREQGVVGAVGIATASADSAAHAFATTDLDMALLSGRYTLVERRSAERVFAAAGQRSIVMADPFCSGILANRRPPEGAFLGNVPASRATLNEAHRLAELAESYGGTLPQAALQFPLLQGNAVSVLVGMQQPDHVAAVTDLLNNRLPAALWWELEEFGGPAVSRLKSAETTERLKP